MRLRYTLIGSLALLWAIGIAPLASAQSAADKAAADEVIALTKALWAADMQKNLADATKNIAEDYTEFNSDYSTRLEGKALATKLTEADYQASGKQIVSEMANAKVQVYGDVAILSYNFIGLNLDKDGKTEPSRAKSTRVYVKQGGKWMLVHANFGADPLPKD